MVLKNIGSGASGRDFKLNGYVFKLYLIESSVSRSTGCVTEYLGEME